MHIQGKNYNTYQVGLFTDLVKHDFRGIIGKVFLGNNIGLTSCEVSLNCLPAGKGMTFVHAHKKNEELYIILSGNGIFYADGDEFALQEGSLIRVSPEGGRALTAGSEDMHFICIQAEANSLQPATIEDGYKLDTKASWMKES
jgi:mannose-6-phosphate isomerase-like protein (cupin superfamily)